MTIHRHVCCEILISLFCLYSHKRDSDKIAAETATAKAEAAEESSKADDKPKASVSADSEAAVQAAMEASEKYGKSSVEARMAWEYVEELDATKSHHKTVGSG